MTFTIRVKEEITRHNISDVEKRSELAGFIAFNGVIKKDKLVLTIENASVARRLYKNIKEIFGINIKVTVRNQKRFRIKQIYILEINEKLSVILESLDILKKGKRKLPEDYTLDSVEEKARFLAGAFMSCGSITDPSSGGYHLEFVTTTKKESIYICKLLETFDIESKILKRQNKYMLYVKIAEMISDLLRIMNATNALFYFEDIRIYRDHKNMVNRLNNCEIANQEKVINTGLKHLEDILYLEENDLVDLLDDKVKVIVNYRKKYPETSYQELADIISLETEYKIGKSGVNHNFIKIKDLIDKHKKRTQ